QGGGLYVATGSVTLTSSTIAVNIAQGGTGGIGGAPGTGSPDGVGGSGGNGGLSQGGGLFVAGGTVDASSAMFTLNVAADSVGGPPGPVGSGAPTAGIGQPGQGNDIFNAGGTVLSPTNLLASR